MKRLFYLILLSSVFTFSYGQNCGLVDTVITTITDNGNGTSDYTFKVYKSTTSGGGKSVVITLYCGTDTMVNGDCQNTGGTQDSVTYGPFTITTCATQLLLDWQGKTTSACGGTTCRDSAGIAVPVSWLNIGLVCNETSVFISWQTASEMNNKGFFVQFQDQQGNWHNSGRVGGNGNSTEIKHYEFDVSEHRLSARNFRIMQEDYNGTISYSKVIRNTCSHENQISFYPNPAKSELHFTAEVEHYEISDSYGIIHKIGNYCHSADLSKLQNGIYFVRYSNGFQTKVKTLIVMED